MNIELIHATPLIIASKAIRKCWASEDKSDNGGEEDLSLIQRVGNKFNHKSTLRHCHLTFDCNDVSTKTLLALTRYTVGKEISVQSTRYTTSKRSDSLSVTYTKDSFVNERLDKVMIMVQECIEHGCKNDDLSMLLPQSYNYSFVVTFNIESLQWFLHQREKRAAHWDIQNFAKMLREKIPEEYQYLFDVSNE